jgi:hypothetical protein
MIISKQKPGFKFFSKDGLKLELLSVEKEDIHVAHGILGDKYQQLITIKFIDKDGKIYRQINLTKELNGGNIYTIAHLENKAWYELTFLTEDTIKKEKKKNEKLLKKEIKKVKAEYKVYLENLVREGKLTELEMHRLIEKEKLNLKL